MKKFLLCSAVALFASVALASGTPRYIITDCGTIHQIPEDATPRDACDYIDAWSNIDCGTTYNMN